MIPTLAPSTGVVGFRANPLDAVQPQNFSPADRFALARGNR
jgi:hypothetical protein